MFEIENPPERFVTPEALLGQIPQHITANHRCHRPLSGL